MTEGSQVLLTFYAGGRLATRRSNAGSKKEIRKILRFRGEIDPETGKFSPILNLTWYEKNNKPLPKNYYQGKPWYKEPKYFQVVRKLRWQWEQVVAMLDTPVGSLKDKSWAKLSELDKLQLHAERCMLPGEYKVKIEVVE